MRRRLRKIIARSSRDGRAVWDYFRRGDTRHDRLRRARNIFFLARHRRQAAARRAKLAEIALSNHPEWSAKSKDKLRRRRDRAKASAEKWGKFRFAYHRQVRRLRRKLEREHRDPDAGDFQPWMLNGHSSNISEGTKAVVTYAVGSCGAIVTDTYDYGGHAPSSNHYPRNNADGKGHAVDLIPATCTLMQQLRDKFGAAFFRELFGPCPYYYKYGVQTQGMFPGHGTHTHAAPVT